MPRESPLLVALYFLACLSVLVRMLLNAGDTGPAEPLAYGLMTAFLAVSIVQPWLGRRWPPARHITLALQTLIVVGLLFTRPPMDFYAMLFVAMSIFAVRDLSNRQGLLWLGIFCFAIVSGLIVAFGERGAGFI